MHRQSAVAGSFYPSDPVVLKNTIKDCFNQSSNVFISHIEDQNLLPKRLFALIVPHAGYIYSGAVAASAYKLLQHKTAVFKKVVLLGPSHRVAFKGIAVPESEVFITPLGAISIDRDVVNLTSRFDFVSQSEHAHSSEHSLEVQLPFLQEISDSFSLVPLVVGDASAEEVRQVINYFSQQQDTLIIVSTDLSHFHTYDEATLIDDKTSQQILDKDFSLRGEQACGCRPLNGLLKQAGLKNYHIEELARCNSGDSGGDKSRVVGYGAYAVYAS